jgi:nucleotide-binding universal stress UspA family protein
MYKRILTPVDGSHTSMLGLREAVKLARDQKARLRIIHVVDESVLVQFPDVMSGAAGLMDTFIKDGKKTLNNALTLAKQHGIRTEGVM